MIALYGKYTKRCSIKLEKVGGNICSNLQIVMWLFHSIHNNCSSCNALECKYLNNKLSLVSEFQMELRKALNAIRINRMTLHLTHITLSLMHTFSQVSSIIV